eukprot:8222514-Heterocapsa_arctica.AAC.1
MSKEPSATLTTPAPDRTVYHTRPGGSSSNLLSTSFSRSLGKSNLKILPPPSRTISTGPFSVAFPKNPPVKRNR